MKFLIQKKKQLNPDQAVVCGLIFNLHFKIQRIQMTYSITEK